MKKIFFRDAKWLDKPLSSAEKVLDVGSGGVKRAKNVTTMDVLDLPNTDVVHNVDVYPWPFPDNSFDYIILSNIIEHVNDLQKFMKEIHRISKKGAVVRGAAPHFSSPCSYADATHKRALSLHVFDLVAESRIAPGLGSFVKKLLGCDMHVLDQCREDLFLINRLSLYFREILWLFLLPVWGNLFQDFFETYSCRLFPAWSIYFELKVLK